MVKVSNDTRILDGCTPDTLPLDELLSFGRPTRSQGHRPPLGPGRARACAPIDDAMNYLRSFYNGKILSASFAASQVDGRLFYNDDFTRLNFEARRTQLGRGTRRNPRAPRRRAAPDHVHRLDARSIRTCLAFARTTTSDSPRSVSMRRPPSGSAIGPSPPVTTTHRTTSPAVAVGRRRFTMFPPEPGGQTCIPGRWSSTPGGQADQPGRFQEPGFREVPAFPRGARGRLFARLSSLATRFSFRRMWWHHVEGLSPFNTLVNYWWSTLAEIRSDANECALSRDLVDSRPTRGGEGGLAAGFRVLRVRSVVARG